LSTTNVVSRNGTASTISGMTTATKAFVFSEPCTDTTPRR